MKNHAQHISAHDVMYSLIPKLNTVEQQIEKTLINSVETSQDNAQKTHYETLKMEFQLELTMIRMNLQHLMKRYQHEFEAVVNDARQDVMLTLDQHEAVAIESAQKLYQRVQSLQAGN